MSQNPGDALSQSLAKISANYPSSSDKKSHSGQTKANQKKMTEEIADDHEVFKDQVFYDLKWSNQAKQEWQLVDCEFHHCDFSNAALDFMQASGCVFHDCNFKNSG